MDNGTYSDLAFTVLGVDVLVELEKDTDEDGDEYISVGIAYAASQSWASGSTVYNLGGDKENFDHLDSGDPARQLKVFETIVGRTGWYMPRGNDRR